MHAPVLSGNQHYHGMVYQILVDLSKALINTISAGRNLKSSTESHLQGQGLEKLMSKHFKKDIYFSILKALWGRNMPCKAFLIYRQAVIALQFLKVKSGNSEGQSAPLLSALLAWDT